MTFPYWFATACGIAALVLLAVAFIFAVMERREQ